MTVSLTCPLCLADQATSEDGSVQIVSTSRLTLEVFFFKNSIIINNAYNFYIHTHTLETIQYSFLLLTR